MGVHRVQYSPLRSRSQEGGAEIRLLRVKRRDRKDDAANAAPDGPRSLAAVASGVYRFFIHAFMWIGGWMVGLTYDYIDCTLETVSLDQTPQYRALSYTWGDPSFTELIVVDGRRASITKNLKQALLALREEEQDIILWVDSVCINQQDDEEKGVQVGMMMEIYSKASSVDVWLGPAANDSDILFAAWADVGSRAFAAGMMDVGMQGIRRIRQAMSDGSALEPAVAKIKKALDALSDQIGPAGIPYEALGHVCRRPYWPRIWILQEFSVARTLRLRCGQASVDFDTFSAADQFTAWHSIRMGLAPEPSDPTAREQRQKSLAAYSQLDSGSLATLTGARRSWLGLTVGRTRRDTLHDLLTRTCFGHPRHWKTKLTDRRDQIYGLLSMAIDYRQLEIPIDYRETKSVEGVFTDAARAMLRCGHLRLLSWNQQPKSEDLPGLPSWVPDFSTSFREPPGDYIYGQKPPFTAGIPPHASSSSSTSVPPPPAPSFTRGLAVALQLTCYRIDTVGDTGTPWSNDFLFDVPATAVYFREIEAFVDRLPAPAPLDSNPPPTSPEASPRPAFPPPQSPTRRASARWRIPTADQAYNGNRTRLTALPAGFAEVRALSALGDPAPAPTDGDAWTAIGAGVRALGREARLYWLNLGYQHGQRPFLSGTGAFAGLVPAGAARGDVVAVVQGVGVPFVFAPQGEGGWRLVGEAYVDGVMDGEVLRCEAVKGERFDVY